MARREFSPPGLSSSFREKPRLRTLSGAAKLWSRGRVPADRSASCGPCGQPVDKLALAHRLTTLADLAPTAPQLQQQ